ncbi:hypothetical protein [Deinococcus rufus]|uniref:Uncharacterized protein n=1 Tax=Deinococcus rufus TaxID=2136097 RepID=A0ABV7ZBQ4_9DEIO
MTTEALNPHAGDDGYWLTVVEGDPSNTAVWATLVPELLVQTARPGRTVRVVAEDHVSIDRGAAVIRWRLAEGDLPRAVVSPARVSDVQAGQRRVLKIITFVVDDPLVAPAP